MCLTIELLDASLNQSTNIRPIRLAYQPLPTIFFSQNKPTTNHQLTILFSQNKSASIGSSIEMLPSSLNDINKIICVQISQLAIGQSTARFEGVDDDKHGHSVTRAMRTMT
jgi:hypothetical protein